MTWRPVLALSVAALLAVWLLDLQLYDSLDVQDDARLDAPTPAARPEGFIPRPRTAPVAPGCTPKSEVVCIQGDPWWMDSCGNVHEQESECGMATCEEGACVPDDPECIDVPIGWQCDGDVARGCVAGKVYSIDCGAKGRTCVMTQEGPVCQEAGPDDCREPTGTTRCEGSELVACVDGREQRFDCTEAGAACLPSRTGERFACVRRGSGFPDDCGPCGCPPSVEAEEVCNGRDDDGDGFIDENGDCGEVDIVAFVVTDDGQASYTRDDLDAELHRINEAFARDDDYGLSFRLAEVIAIDHEAWMQIDDVETQEILTGTTLSLDREAMYVPILFTEELLFEEVPRPGLATPPNGMCGGQRRIRSPQPGLGGLIIAKRRWGTTVAHEIGHYLGLCHTHMPAVDAVEVFDGDGDGAQACAEPCAWEGDGVCDTPPDPGPDACTVDPACGIACADGATPAPDNIMAYYPTCRTLFSVEQALVMRQALAWRRGWHPCLFGDGCACEPAASECPEQMSCRRYVIDAQTLWRCGLDGATIPGAACGSSEDCSKGATCIADAQGDTRCVRPCRPAVAPCDCREVGGIDFPLCVDDLRGG